MGKITDQWLSFLALVCSVAGIAALFFLSQHIEPPLMKINQVKDNNIGDYVTVQGVVCRLRESKGNTFLTLCDNGEIDVPLFDAKADIEIGDFVRVTGTVSLYEKNLQIQIDSLNEVKVIKILWGICTNGRIETEKGALPIKGIHEGPCGLAEEEGMVLRPSSARTIGGVLEFSGRVSGVRRFEGFTIFSIFGMEDDFFTLDEIDVAQEISGMGLLCEKDSYEEIFVLRYERDEPETESIASVHNRPEGFPVQTRGTVVFLKQYAETTYMKLRDDSGHIFVSAPRTDEVSEGNVVEARGILKEGKIYCYEGRITVISTGQRRMKIEDINRDFLGETMYVSGDVRSVIVSEAFVSLTVKDKTASILVYFPEDVLENLENQGIEPRTLRIGDYVEIEGVLDEYRGQLEIIPESISIETGDFVLPVSLLSEHMGETVMVEGVVMTIDISSKGHVLISLKDETDSVDVVFFADAAQEMREIYSVKVGERIRVWGKIQLYEGDIEIVGEGFERIYSFVLSTRAMQSPTLRASSESCFPERCLRRWGISIWTPFSGALLTMFWRDSPLTNL